MIVDRGLLIVLIKWIILVINNMINGMKLLVVIFKFSNSKMNLSYIFKEWLWCYLIIWLWSIIIYWLLMR